MANDFYLVSSHGAALFCIAAHPDCTTTDLARAMSVTPRTISRLVGDLRRAGMLDVRKEGRRHHYTVNLNAPFLHPTLTGFTLRPVLGGIIERAGSRTRAA